MLDAILRFAVVYAVVVVVPAVAVGVAAALSRRERLGDLYPPVVTGLVIAVLFLEALVLIAHPSLGDTAMGPMGVGIAMAGTTAVVLRAGHVAGLPGPLPWRATVLTAATLGAIFWGMASLG